MRWHALVRPPGRSFARAISSTGAAIDVELARRQHELYCEALRAAGAEVEVLPVDDRFPDGCFMQDPALVIAGKAIIARPGALSRRGEEQLVAPLLEARFPTFRIEAPGTLEGGDVLVLADRVYVGASDRSNEAGIEQLRAALAPLPVAAIPVQGLLHLLSGVTSLGGNTLLAVEAMAGRAEFKGMQVLRVPDGEEYACNVLGLLRLRSAPNCGRNSAQDAFMSAPIMRQPKHNGDPRRNSAQDAGAGGQRRDFAQDGFVIVPAGYERTAAMLAAHGFRVLPVPVSEFAKADGGVTCLSLVYPETV